jgi:hypothetical protein
MKTKMLPSILHWSPLSFCGLPIIKMKKIQNKIETPNIGLL